MNGGNGIDAHANDEAARRLLGGEGTKPIAPDAAGGANRGVAEVDDESGEVYGGGSGAGGGNAGEDYDDDHTAGSNTAR